MADSSEAPGSENGTEFAITDSNGDVTTTALSILNVRDFCNNLTQSLSKELLKNGNGINGTGLERRQLGTLLDRPDFQALLRLHKMVSAHRSKNAQPTESDAATTLDEFIRLISDDENSKSSSNKHASPAGSNSRKGSIPISNGTEELRRLLDNIQFRSLLNAHDRIARKEFEPCLPEVPYEVDEDEGCAVKIVRLIKNNEPLGATIKVRVFGRRRRMSRVGPVGNRHVRCPFLSLDFGTQTFLFFSRSRAAAIWS